MIFLSRMFQIEYLSYYYICPSFLHNLQVHLHKIRTDQLVSEETVVQQDSSGDEAAPEPPEEDEFDRLLQQQIDLARATPTPSSVRKELQTPIQPIINR